METTSIVTKQTKLVNEESKILRECRGRRLAISRKIFRLQNTSVFYVQSERVDNRWYLVKYKFEPKEFYCTCPDWASNRSDICKHGYAVLTATNIGLVQQIDHKLQISQKGAKMISALKPKSTVAEQYKDLSIATLNEIEKAEIEAEAYRTQRQHNWEDDEYTF
ncbi:MAG: SWIM zinc finger domain-containing protein [Nitrososphaeraceae archaeon]|nr:SWIM zinc finger domain-containing protein [Nitrososphaeraceae archaeon]